MCMDPFKHSYADQDTNCERDVEVAGMIVDPYLPNHGEQNLNYLREHSLPYTILPRALLLLH